MKKVSIITATAVLSMGLTTVALAGGSVAKTSVPAAKQQYATPQPASCNKDSKHACMVTKEGMKLCGCFNKVHLQKMKQGAKKDVYTVNPTNSKITGNGPSQSMNNEFLKKE